MGFDADVVEYWGEQVEDFFCRLDVQNEEAPRVSAKTPLALTLPDCRISCNCLPPTWRTSITFSRSVMVSCVSYLVKICTTPPFPTLPTGAIEPIVAKAARRALLPRMPLPRTPVNKAQRGCVCGGCAAPRMLLIM